MKSNHILEELCEDFGHSYMWDENRKLISDKYLNWFLDAHNQEKGITDRTSDRYQLQVTETIKIDNKNRIVKIQPFRDGLGIIEVVQ